jgi:hypothetical protein
MSDNHSTTPPPSDKPDKPSPDFPLFPHTTKRWAKKIKGQMRYFGPGDDPEGALRAYRAFLSGQSLTPILGHTLTPAPAGRTAKSNKPSKPYPNFPLFPHASGQWAKRIRGQRIGSYAPARFRLRYRFNAFADSLLLI